MQICVECAVLFVRGFNQHSKIVCGHECRKVRNLRFKRAWNKLYADKVKASRDKWAARYPEKVKANREKWISRNREKYLEVKRESQRRRRHAAKSAEMVRS